MEYVVREVQGRPPTTDGDFEGELALHVVYDHPDSAVLQDMVLRGVGMASDSGIFFNEKDDSGKDLRRWRIVRKDEDGTYVGKQGLY